MKKNQHSLKCKHCKTSFIATRSDAKFCSVLCRKRSARPHKKKPKTNPQIECANPNCSNMTTNKLHCSKACVHASMVFNMWDKSFTNPFLNYMIKNCKRSKTVEVLGVIEQGKYRRFSETDLEDLYQHKKAMASYNGYGYVHKPSKNNPDRYKFEHNTKFHSSHIHPAVSHTTRGLLNSKNLVALPADINRKASNSIVKSVENYQCLQVENLDSMWLISDESDKDILEMIDLYLLGSVRELVAKHKLKPKRVKVKSNNPLTQKRKKFYHEAKSNFHVLNIEAQRFSFNYEAFNKSKSGLSIDEFSRAGLKAISVLDSDYILEPLELEDVVSLFSDDIPLYSEDDGISCFYGYATPDNW